MRRLLCLAILLTLGLGCDPPPDGSDAGRLDGALPLDAALDVGSDVGAIDAPISGDAPGRVRSYVRSTASFPNPERGFYRAVNLLAESELDWLRDEHPNDALIYSYVRLDAFRDRAIDDATLTALRDALAVARADGFEVILRFAYNEGPYPDSEPDAPLSRIEGHVAQVAPILAANTDVIALVQAGFIGAWGEWHTSTNDLDGDPAARLAVVQALLEALPSTRSTQVRYPPYIADLIGGEPLDPSRAWDGSFASRIGFHNDCFVSSETDVGTYPSDAIETWRTFASEHTAFAPSGGETCAPFPARSACAPAIAEMEAMHFSFVNRDYHPVIVSGWQDEGCIDEIERRLGYRLVLTEATLPDAVRPGGSFALSVALTNEGFAAPFNPRPLKIVIDGPGGRFEVTLPDDVRRWLPGEHTLVARLGLPALEPGEYSVSLWLPSSEASVEGDPRFAIRLASEAVWDAGTGRNTLGTFTVDASAPGTGDPGATTLRLLPR